MRVLHVYTQHRGGGGAENAVRNTMAISAAHGIEVQEFTRSSEDLPANLLGRLSAGVSALYSPASVRAFRARVDWFQPDVVHIHDLFPLISPGILAECARRRLPVLMSCVHYRLTCPVVTHFSKGEICSRCAGGREHWAVIRNCRGNIAESTTVALYNMIASRLGTFTRHVTRFLAPSEFTRRWLIDKGGIAPDRITTVVPAVVIPANAADASAGTYVAFTGRFTAEKGVRVVLDAAARLPRIPFVLCRNERFLAHELPPGVDVHITHGPEELHDFYRDARMLVAPSLWFETFGMVAAEALSHGIPVIASRLGALAELIEDGNNGLLFEPGNAVDLADKVARLWNDPQLCARLGRAAREKAQNIWGYARHFEALYAVYEDVTHAPGAGVGQRGRVREQIPQ